MSEQKPAISLNLDTDFLKVIAAVSMLCDHFGKIYFPEIIIMQIFGRISFPIFAYCSVVGVLYTRDIKKYMLRIGIFAVLSQFIYIQAFAPGTLNPYAYFRYKNILFTLLTGIVAVYGWKERRWPLVALGVIIGLYGQIDYGIFAIILMLSFYLFRDNRLISLIVVAFLLALQFFKITAPVNILNHTVGINGFALLSLPFIYMKTNVNLKINRYFFYIFYPAHLFVLFLLHGFM